MPSAAVEIAFRTKLVSGWVTAERPMIGVNGVTEPPADVNSFLVVQYPVVNTSKPVLGGRRFEEGIARLVLNVRSGLSLDVVLPWGDTLAALFRGSDGRPYKSPTVPGFETGTPSAPIVDDANDDGNWFELAVNVPYRYQFNG